MPDDESHLLGRAKACRNNEITFILAVVIVGHDNDLASGERLDSRFYAGMGLRYATCAACF